MANITPRHDKAGKVISYRIRVSRGYDLEGNKLKPYEMTFKPAPGMTRRQAEKEVQRQALLFEEQCRQGYAPDNRQTFAQYAAYAMQCKEQAGRKRRTLERYQDLLQRINAGIGHIKLAELRPQHLTAFYNQLRQAGVRTSSGVAAPIADFRAVMAQKQLTRERLAACSGVSPTTITSLCKGNRIQAQCAERLADALEMDKAALFSFQVSTKPLAEKTVLEYHRLIASILAQAEKEMLVPYNAAEKVVNKPKSACSHLVNYFQPEELERIRDALEQEPLKWQVITHLLLVTGCRRGEIMGLKWSAVDLQAPCALKTICCTPGSWEFMRIPPKQKPPPVSSVSRRKPHSCCADTGRNGKHCGRPMAHPGTATYRFPPAAESSTVSGRNSCLYGRRLARWATP